MAISEAVATIATSGIVSEAVESLGQSDRSGKDSRS